MCVPFSRAVSSSAVTAAALLTMAVPAGAQPAPRPPRLFVVITVDQLRADYLERFGAHFTGGLARLARDGAVFANAFQDHGITETAPGHAAVLSGRYPYSTGIVRNDEGVPDDAATLVGITGIGASPHRFRGSTLLDWLRERWPGSRMLSVSKKDRGAILPVGLAREGVQVYWYAADVFTTSNYYADSLPGWVRAFNSRLPAARAADRWWTLQRDSASYPEPDSVPWENRGREFVFPHAMSDTALHRRPWMDSLLLTLALEGARAMRLGNSRSPDILAVSLSTLDYIGHEFGPESREVHDMMLWLDRYLGAFLDALDRRYGRNRVVLALTSDHGITARPEASWRRGAAAAFVAVDSVLRPLRDTLMLRLGPSPGRWIPWRDVGMVALDRFALARRGIDVDSLAAAIADRLRRLPGVAQVDTRLTLAGADTVANTAARRWVRMLSPDTPGEVFVTLAPLHYMGRPRNVQHGQPSDDDARVPLILAGPGVRPGVYTGKAAVVDLGPTLAALAGVRPTEPVDGRVLSEALR